MRSLLAAGLFIVAAAFAFAGRADATTEFCPAVLDDARVAQSPSGASLYGIQLRALSARRVEARVAFDTSAGWFTIDLPAAALVDSVRTIPLRYPVDVVLAASPVMYVRFPAGVRVDRAFVTSAVSYGDAFHWSDRGRVSCTPASETWPDPKYSLADVTGLSAAPPAGAQILTPVRRAPLESASCPAPFEQARVTKQATAAYPDAARVVGASGTVVIAAAVDPDNSLADAWVQGTSNDATLDAAALAAVQSSTLTAARAYCQVIPGIYYFTVTFDAKA